MPVRLRRHTARADVAFEERRARIAKLHAETALLNLQLSPAERRRDRIKSIAGVSGVVTATAALLALLLSTYQWFRSDKLNRDVRVEERLERALKLLGDTAPAARLAGVATLASFLRDIDDAHAPQVLLALTNSLSIESSLTVRNAIVTTFTGVNPKVVKSSQLDETLVSLVQISRGLVQEGNLWRTRRDNLYFSPSPDTIEARAVSVAQALCALLRAGAKAQDLTRIYLAGMDLNHISLPGVKFDDSILAGCAFRHANLRQASF